MTRADVVGPPVGRGQGGVVEVPVEVEVLVVDPLRAGQPQRGLEQLLAVARDQVQPCLQALAHRLVREPGPALEHERAADRHVDRAALLFTPTQREQ